MSLLGAATLTLGLILVRGRRQVDVDMKRQVPAGERTARAVSLERLRELGF